MKNHDFTIKRKGIWFSFYFDIFILLLYPVIHCSFLGYVAPFTDVTSIILYMLFVTAISILVYSILQFSVKVTDEKLVINNVSTVRYEDIRKAYIGKFSFIESFEKRDNLPLLPFKDTVMESFFPEHKGKKFPHGYLLVLHTDKNLFFVKASYFDKKSFLRLVMTLDKKNVQIEAENEFLKEKAF